MGPIRTSAGVVLAMLATAAGAAGAPAGSTILVSRPDGLGPPPVAFDGGASVPSAMSDDGRYAAFGSTAPLAPGAGPGTNLFLRDTQTGTTTFINRSDGVGGAAANTGVEPFSGTAVAVESGTAALDPPHDVPHVLVAFVSKATNLVDHFDSLNGGGPAATGGLGEIWLRDVTAGTTYLVSRAVGKTGAPANGVSAHPSLAITDHNGPVIAFSSFATNLGVNPGESDSNVYLRTLNSGGTQQVSCHAQSCPNAAPGVSSGAPSLRFVPATAPHPTTVCPAAPVGCVVVAFDTNDATITGDPASGSQIVVANATETIGISAFNSFATVSKQDGSATVLGNDLSQDPALSPDGLLVGFFSRATNLGAAPPLGSGEIFTRTLDGTGITTLVSRGTGGAIADGGAFDVAVSGSAAHRRVTFTAVAGNFGVPDPTLGSPRAWERDLSTGTTELLDRPAGTGVTPGDGSSTQFGVSADGTKALFESSSHNLGAGGGIDFTRLYVRHLDTESLDLVSRPTGTGAFPTGVRESAIGRSTVSADGRFVAFQSNTDDLASGEDNRFRAVFVRDLQTGSTTLVSRGTGGGAAANADATVVGISDNGRRVLFNTEATNLVPGPAADRAYVRDLDTGTTTVVTRGNGPTGTVTTGVGTSLSGDGNSVAFITRSVLDPDAAPGVEHVYVRNLAAQTTAFVDRDNGPSGSSAFASAGDAVIDRDGGRVAWTTPAGLAGISGTGSLDRLYERDLRAGTTILVSRADGGNGAVANAAITAPAINANGNVVAFASAATNLGVAVTAQAVWVRDIAGQHVALASRASGATGAPADATAASPSLDAAGDRVGFRSAAGNLGAGPQASLNDSQAYVRDLGSAVTDLASRANGQGGAPFDRPGFGHISLSANGDCAVFDATGLNSGDGFASAQFAAVHLRVLRNQCPLPRTITPPPPPVTKPLPVLRALKLVPARFAVRPRRKPKHRPHVPQGSSIRFSLSRAARVNFRVERARPGRRSGKRCLPARGKIAKRRRCTRYVKVGSFGAVIKRPGAKRVGFSGRIGKRALATGPYRLTATPVDPLGRRTRSRTTTFTILTLH